MSQPARKLSLAKTPGDAREKTLPYGRQTIDDADIREVMAVLQSDWLTTGPKVGEFEQAFCLSTGAKESVAVSNGTAALHTAVNALGIKAGDEVIVPTLTFAASANSVLYAGAKPVFVDVQPDTLLIDPSKLEKHLTSKTRAIIAVDYAGQPCDYRELRQIADQKGLKLISDACHALGAEYDGKKVGCIADLTAFSFHPVKHITTGEGGMVTTQYSALAKKMRTFRNHGITTDHSERERIGSWQYEMVELGYNYRLSDIQCALGISQLKKLETWNDRRRAIAARYDAAFSKLPQLSALKTSPNRKHAYHLYVVQLELGRLKCDRTEFYHGMRAEKLGVNVHYMPVHLHPYYRKTFGTAPGQCPVAEAAYERILSLPMYPSISDAEVERVIQSTVRICQKFAR